MNRFRALIVLCFCLWAVAAVAASVSTPNLPTIGPVSTGDLLVGTRNGVTYNLSWPPSGGISVNSFLGSVTTANPSINGDATSGFYTPGAAQAGVVISGVAKAVWAATRTYSYNALTVDLNAAALNATLTGSVLQLGNATGVQTRIESDTYASAAYLSSVRSDGTIASPTTLQANDEIGGVNAYGYNGAAIVGPQASVGEFAAANWTTTGNGTYVSIKTTPNGSTTQTEVARFNQDGSVLFPATVTGGACGAGCLNVGSLEVNGVAAGTGSVSTVSVVTANGISGSVSNPTTTPAITLTLGAINPSSIGATTSAAGTFTTMTAANAAISGTTTTSNLTVTGTCTGCGSATPGGTAPNLQYKTGTSFGGATGLYYSTTRSGLDLASSTTGNGLSVGNAGTDFTSLAIGPNALLNNVTTTGHDTAAGDLALTLNTTGTDDTAFGYNALATAVTDQYTTAVGSGTLQSQAIGTTTTVTGNTAVGYFAGHTVTTGTANTFYGNIAGAVCATCNNDTLIGSAAQLTTSTNTDAVGIGNNVSVGNYDTAVGWSAKAADTGGNGGVSVGYRAGIGGTAASVALGYDALANSTSGFNVAIGSLAGSHATSGHNNIFIGYQVGNATITTGSSNILIATAATDVPAASTSNWLNIGGAIMGTLVAPTISSGFGSSPSVPSGSSSESFTVNVGTGGSATSGVILFATAAPTGWACDVTDSTSVGTITTASVPTSTTTATWTSYSRTTGVSTAWNASDILVAKCGAY